MHDDEPSTVGWDAITEALNVLYQGQEPRHWGTIVSARLGGPDPLDGISAYIHDDGVHPPHWHFISLGMSELYAKESADPKVSGWGFEFTFRLPRVANEANPPMWPLSLLQNLARYVCESGNVFAPGHRMPLNGPIAQDHDTQIRAVMFVEDPQLRSLLTPNGSLRFLQLVGCTMDELDAARAWNSDSLLKCMQLSNPLLITDLARRSMLADPRTSKLVAEGTDRDGSSSAACHTYEAWFSMNDKDNSASQTVITLGASTISEFCALLSGRVPFNREFQVFGADQSMRFVPSERFHVTLTASDELCVHVPARMARDLAAKLQPKRGDYQSSESPSLVVRVIPTLIKDAEGKNVVETIG